MEEIKWRIKKWLMPVAGVVAMIAFLVLCSEPAPGEEISLWAFAWPKLIAMAVIGGCVLLINRLDNKKY